MKQSLNRRNSFENFYFKTGCPYIVQIIEVYENLLKNDERIFYVVMELMNGGRLFDKLDQKRAFSEQGYSFLFKIIIF